MKIPGLKNKLRLHRFLANNPQWGWHGLVERHGKEFAFEKALVVADAEKAHDLMHSRAHTKVRSKTYKQAAELIPGAPGILFEDGDIWQNKLQNVMPVFTKQNLERYRLVLQTVNKEEVQKLKDKKVSDDFYIDITHIGLRLVFELGYGLNFGHPLVQDYARSLRDYKLMTMYKIYRVDRFGIGFYQLFSLPKLYFGIRELKRQMVLQEKQLQAILKNPNTRNGIEVNWIDLLKNAGFNSKEICTEINHIYGAFNAIDYTLTCALFELSRRPDLRVLLVAELINKDVNELSNWKEQVEKLPETMCFMREVFRYYPVAISVMRSSGEVYEAAGKQWAKGTEIYLMIQSLHFNPEYWEVPRNFNPDRFKRPLKEPKAYIPFLTGSRKCIGQHLAELHFLHSLHAFAQTGFPTVNGNFSIQPYLIPRLQNKIRATYG